MNTSKLKPFAQQARKILMEGVRLRMLFWGFDEKNEKVVDEPEAIPGGVIFRNEIYNDVGLLAKWEQMKARISTHTYKDAIEEAAYTWFNRLMALKILEKNDLEEKQLGYEGAVPAILEKARNGIMPFLGENEKQKVREKLLAGEEERAFSILLVGYFHNHSLLSRVFGGIDDFTELVLPNNLLATGGLIELLNINGFIQEQDYKEVELIGWLYQFYISEKKDEVFKGFKENRKARKEDIPAATQIFTPKWIVKYLVENTVGKTWLDHQPDSGFRSQLKYLVENTSASLAHTNQIEVKNITLLDPACGSGHILVTAFELYMLIYKEVGLTTRQAVREILRYNLFGLDIDKRAVQLACFALLMKAAYYDREILNVNILPHIYSMPEPTYFNREVLEKFLFENEDLKLDRDGIVKDLAKGLDLMRQSQNLGSIIQFDLQDDTRGQLKRRYTHWKTIEEKNQLTFDQMSWWMTLSQYLNPLSVLLDQYTCVAANPPYMSHKNMNGELKNYITKYYSQSKGDLFAVFIEKLIQFTNTHGRFSMITQQSWMFLSSFEGLRKSLLTNCAIENLLHLGLHVFKELNSKIVQSVAFQIQVNPSKKPGIYYDLQKENNLELKEKTFLGQQRYFVKDQKDFLKIPSLTIAYWASPNALQAFEGDLIINHSTSFQGMITGDNEKYVRCWHEVNHKLINLGITDYRPNEYTQKYWCPFNKGGDSVKWYGNQDFVINFAEEGRDFVRSRKTFSNYYFNENISWSYISLSLVARYYPQGFIWDVSGSSLFPKNKEDGMYILPLLNSSVGNYFLEILNPTLNFQVENILAVPLIFGDEDEMNLIRKLSLKNIEATKNIYDSYETSWDFRQSALMNKAKTINDSFEKWLQEISFSFIEIHSNEEIMNNMFIKIYGLELDLKQSVPLNTITVLRDEIDYSRLVEFDRKGLIPIKPEVVIQQFISYGIGLVFGRYRLDRQGLNIAHPDFTLEELTDYQFNGNDFHISQDAIIPFVDEEGPFSNTVSKEFKNILVCIWGEDTLTENINYINKNLGISIDRFFTERFWDYHKRVYQKKPIYWLFASPAGTFKVLVYMHRMDKFTVQKIRLNYLHRYIEYLISQIQIAENSNVTARTIDKFNTALQDCREYDRILKPLADQQISFDLDDGVTLNYEKFRPASAPLR